MLAHSQCTHKPGKNFRIGCRLDEIIVRAADTDTGTRYARVCQVREDFGSSEKMKFEAVVKKRP
ncbi:MAG: hypothetical protein IPM23_21585 [Candidatus Melainabacteria bacterium]|nr:hypothetical protein [Candidatus Melainabacteria bacterium]